MSRERHENMGKKGWVRSGCKGFVIEYGRERDGQRDGKREL